MWLVVGVPVNVNPATPTSYWTVPVSLVSAVGLGATDFPNNRDVCLMVFSGDYADVTYTVATLPAGVAGGMAYASDARVFDGAGTLEGVGDGTGSRVFHNGTAWKIPGTNVTAVA